VKATDQLSFVNRPETCFYDIFFQKSPDLRMCSMIFYKPKLSHTSWTTKKSRWSP